MRVLFLIPDLRRGILPKARAWVERHGFKRRFASAPGLWASHAFGGTLNIMRQCSLARSLGVDAVLATESGTDTYGSHGIGALPFVAWDDRRRDDLCVIPDVYSSLAAAVDGDVVVYLQAPNLVQRDFDHLQPNVRLWTCSPLVSERCRTVLPGKEPIFVPNIVDCASFPYIPQEQRQQGRLAALPRKGAINFIRETYELYRRGGGRYWELDLIDGLRFADFAARYRTPQALLPATDIEGCGMPAMEAMAAGIVVAGRNGGGGSFYMRDDETALIANTVDEAAIALRAIEDPQLRQRLAQAAYEAIRDFFPDAAPKRFWEGFVAELETAK